MMRSMGIGNQGQATSQETESRPERIGIGAFARVLLMCRECLRSFVCLGLQDWQDCSIHVCTICRAPIKLSYFVRY